MRIALVNPGRRNDFAIHEPLNLGYLAGVLEQAGHHVRILDQQAGDDINRELNNWMPDLVGLTGTTPVMPDAYEIADACRRRGIRTIIGGVHASTFPEDALNHADQVIVGEGELVVNDVVTQVRKERIVQAEYHKNIDKLPFPARHLMNMEFYLRTKERIFGTHLLFVPNGYRTAAIMTSRGCPYKCVFCHNSWRPSPVRFHSPAYVIQEIKELITRYQVQALFFFDDNFFSQKTRVLEICELLRREQLSIIWGCQARAEHVTEELLRAVYAAGCQQITFGLESGSQRVLDSLKTGGVTLEQNRRAVELCHRLGFKTWGTFMIGSPGETLEDIRETRRFMRSLPLSGAMIHVTTAFPGTPLWVDAVKRGKVSPDSQWQNFTTADASVNVGWFSNRTLRKIRRKLLLSEVILQGKFDWRAVLRLCIRNPTQVLARILNILVTER